MREKIIIDTFPMIEYLFRRFCVSFNRKHLEKEITILKGPYQEENFKKYLKNRDVFITSATITELQNRQRKHLKNDREKFWRLFFEEYRHLKFNETIIELSNIDTDLITKFGFADAVNFTAAKNKQAILLLKDKGLKNYCHINEVNSKDFHDFSVFP